MRTSLLLVPIVVFLWGPPSTEARPTVTVTPADAHPAPAVAPAPIADPPPALGVTDPARVSAAVAHFEAHGLEVPPVDVYFHTETSGCRGHLGLHRPAFDRVDVCTELPFVLVHELAHVWVHEHVDETGREAVLERFGLEVWHDDEVEWGERGIERAAFAMQQVLMAPDQGGDSDEWRERRTIVEFLVSISRGGVG